MAEPMNEAGEEDMQHLRDNSFWLETITSKIQETEAATADISRQFGVIEGCQRTITSKTQQIKDATAEVKIHFGVIADSQRTITSKSQDIAAVTADISRKFSVIAASISAIKQGMVEIGRLNEERDISNSQQETSLAALDESFEVNEKTLSSTAKSIINDLLDGPLHPDVILDFLMEKTFGKPKPSVLPILRGYISNQMLDRFGTDQEVIRKTCEQLESLRDQMKRAHLEYNEEHRRKDVNLERRTERLLENITKELAAEGNCGMRQPSIAGFLKTGTKRKLTN